MNINDLLLPFPMDAISWRAQSVTKDGKKAMALAYIDARDVMRRLDAVCGAGNWKDSYVETPSGRIICTLSINVPTGVPESPYYEWVSKSDGAGDTDVEGEKGAISDAFKRAAVKWGIGRYLYDMPAPWVPCKAYERNGKWVWSGWEDGIDPWKFISPPDKKSIWPNAAKRNAFAESIIRVIDASLTNDDLQQIADDNKESFDAMNDGNEYDKLVMGEIRTRFKQKKTQLKEEDARLEQMKEQLRERE